jgi:hypothetical protein
MTEQELSYLRDLHAGFAVVGLLMKGVEPTEVATISYEIADAMQEARTASAGIVSVKRRYSRKDKNHE